MSLEDRDQTPDNELFGYFLRRKSEITIEAVSIIYLLERISKALYIYLQVYEWFSIAFVIKYEKDLTIDDIRKNLEGKTNRCLFSVREQRYKYLFIFCAIITFGYHISVYVTNMLQICPYLRQIEELTVKSYILVSSSRRYSIINKTIYWSVFSQILWWLPVYFIFYHMAQVMQQHQNYQYQLKKKGLITLACGMYFISIIEIVQLVATYHYIKEFDYCATQPINKKQFQEKCVDGLPNYYLLFDNLMGISNIFFALIIINFKKCEDYIACFSKVLTMQLVSIHQYRILDDGTIDRQGLLETIGKRQKRQKLLFGDQRRPTSHQQFSQLLEHPRHTRINSSVTHSRQQSWDQQDANTQIMLDTCTSQQQKESIIQSILERRSPLNAQSIRLEKKVSQITEEEVPEGLILNSLDNPGSLLDIDMSMIRDESMQGTNLY